MIESETRQSDERAEQAEEIPRRMGKALVILDNITARLHSKLILPNSSWRIEGDQQWAILGPNGSGKSTLARTLWGGVPLRSGRILYHLEGPEGDPQLTPRREAIGYVSFETHQRLMEHEETEAELRAFAGGKGKAATAQDVVYSGILANRTLSLIDPKRCIDIADLLGIRSLLHQEVTSLSTGEMRKTLIARALIKSPKLLILDEPFDGLDESSRRSLADSINELMAEPLRIILIVHRLEEIVPRITHVLFVKDGRLLMQGPKKDLLTSEKISRLYGCHLHLLEKEGQYRLADARDEKEGFASDLITGEASREGPEILIEMKEVTIRYDSRLILDRFNWVMRRGENWAIFGRNGSGKSTILRLILGENLQAYGNQIRLFGRQKGTGETLWEIRKQIGAVSAELQVQYRKKMSADDVIASGFYDSIGLYQYPTAEQKEIVDQWITILHIEDIAKEPYHHLSYGQKRMILLARAMVKSPVLLIVDEPCHGLDIPNRKRILAVLEQIGRTQTNLLFVTNHEDEIPDCVTHVMRIRKGRVLNQGRREEVLRRHESPEAFQLRPLS